MAWPRARGCWSRTTLTEALRGPAGQASAVRCRRDRGRPGRTRGLVDVRVRRPRRGGAPVGAGLQAGRRRRHRPEHRRHGGVLPGTGRDARHAEHLAASIVEPTLAELRRQGIDYRGVLYAGLMLTARRARSVLEYNVRFGDPETQVVLPRLGGDLAALPRRGRPGPDRIGTDGPRRRGRHGGGRDRGLPDRAVHRRCDRRPRRGRGRARRDRLLRRRRGRARWSPGHRRRSCPDGHRSRPHVDAARARAYEAVGRHRLARSAPSVRHRRGRCENRRRDHAYELPEMAAIFSDTARCQRWLDIELLATEAWARARRRPRCPMPPPAGRQPRWSTTPSWPPVDERERVTDHDVAAFVDVVQESHRWRPGQWIHYGLTSSDVVDTASCWIAARRRRPAARRRRRS